MVAPKLSALSTFHIADHRKPIASTTSAAKLRKKLNADRVRSIEAQMVDKAIGDSMRLKILKADEASLPKRLLEKKAKMAKQKAGK
jgi:hypothetical protein